MVIQHGFHKAVAVFHVGEVALVGVHVSALGLQLAGHFIQGFLGAGTNHQNCAGLGQLLCGRQANTGGCACHHAHLAFHRTFQGAILEQVRVQVALPVVPDNRGVVRQARHFNTGALQHALQFPGIKTGRVVDERHHRCRDAKILQHRTGNTLHRRQVLDALADKRRNKAEHPGVDAHAHTRSMAGFAEDIENLAHFVRIRIDQVETIAVFTVQVGNVIEGIRHKVHRNNIQAAALDADRRHPLRQRVADLLNHFEEVVWPVDLVHFAGFGMADHHAGAVDTERHLALFPHYFFGFVLGAQVRMIQLFRFFKHIFAENTLEQAGSGNRRNVVEMLCAHGFGSLNSSPGAFNIGCCLGLFIGAHVVHSGQVEEVINIPLQGFHGLGINAEILAGEVADNRLYPAVIHTPALAQLCQLVLRLLAYQNVYGTAPGQQFFYQKTTDKTGAACQEIIHKYSILPVALLLSVHQRTIRLKS